MDPNDGVPEHVLEAYGAAGAPVDLLTGGRTNRTMRVRAGRGLVLQHLRATGESDLLGIMDNLVRVTSHLDWRERMGDEFGNGGSGADAVAWWPELVPTVTGKPFIMDPEGNVWRAYTYRDGRIARSNLPPATFVSSAALFGRFSRATLDLDGPPLLETTPAFHHLDNVWTHFEGHCDNADAAAMEPVAQVLADVERVRQQLNGRIAADGLSSTRHRVVHNDTKMSNVLLHETSSDAIAVLDLDLVMMGPIWHDVGDLIRSIAWHADPTGPAMAAPLFDTVTAAFVRAAGDSLTDDEIATFATAGPRLSFELGVRYICDHLSDDPVLRVKGENGHLLRGLANVKLAEEMLNAYDALRSVVDDLIARR